MIKIPFSEIVRKTIEKTNISEEELNTKIKDKMSQLSGLISKEGAAHIVANELGVRLFEEFSGKLQIQNILAGIRDVETTGKVQQIYNITEFQRRDGSKGKVANIIIADSTGSIRIVLWGSQTDSLKELKEGDVVKIIAGYVRENNNRVEIHLNERSKLIINPEGETIGNVKQYISKRKKIEELEENDSDVELLGTIVQIFELRFFEVCPTCNKRIRPKGEGFFCEEHNMIVPNYSYVLNLVMDDGSETIRTCFFKKQTENLLEMNEEQILGYKNNPERFEDIKNNLVGTTIKVVGRVNKNEMFDRLEFIVRLVFSKPDLGEELERLKKEKGNEDIKKVESESSEELSDELPTVEEI